jgi:hypothetical protein
MTTTNYLTLAVFFLGGLLGIVFWFTQRMVKQYDDALAARLAADAARDAAEAKTREQITKLTDALDKQVAESGRLRDSLARLLQSFSAWDKWIYGELQHGTFKTKPPQFDHSGPVPAPLAA